MEQKKSLDIASLASIPLVMTLGNSMLIPVLPKMEKTLRVSSFQISLVITVYSVVAIFLIPVAGYLSDKFGRKIIIIPSLIVAAAGGLISGLGAWWLKDSYWIILGGRLIQGIGAAGAAPIVMPLVGDIFRNDADVSRGLGLIETANTFGKVVSPVLGSLLAAWIWFIPFLSIPAFCLVSIGLVLFLVKTPKKQPEDAVPFKQFLQTIRQIFQNKGKWISAIFAIGGIAMFVIFGSMFYLSSTLEDTFHIKGVIKGLVLAIPLGALCLASFAAGKLISNDTKRMKWTAFSGCVIQVAAITAAALFSNIYFVIGALLFGGIGIGLALPCLDSMITEGIEKEERGTVTSLYNSVRYIGVAAGPPAIALLTKVSHEAVFFTMSGVCVAAGILSLFFIRPGHKKDGDDGWKTSSSVHDEASKQVSPRRGQVGDGSRA